MISAVDILNLFNLKIFFNITAQNIILKHYFRINTIFMICVNSIQMGSFKGQAVARIFKFVENVFIIERKHMALDTEKVFKTIYIFRFIYM